MTKEKLKKQKEIISFSLLKVGDKATMNEYCHKKGKKVSQLARELLYQEVFKQ